MPEVIHFFTKITGKQNPEDRMILHSAAQEILDFLFGTVLIWAIHLGRPLNGHFFDSTPAFPIRKNE